MSDQTASVLPTVCVIGAGISGLTAGKMLRDYRIPYECFELSDRVGGNWAFGNPNGRSSAYRSLHIDTSKARLSLKDFPVPANAPDFLHHTEIKAYLDDYADAFSLRDRIGFCNGVLRAARLPGGGWEVHTQDGQRRRFDVLVVGNGHHSEPRYPEFPGEFSGPTIHSHQYLDPREPLELEGKRILVVGIGNSAADIVSELSQRCYRNRVVLSTRSGAWVVPKYASGRPIDRLVRTVPQIPLSWQRAALRPAARLLSGRPEHYGLPRPDHRFMDAHPTISSELLLRLGSGDAVAKPNVARLDGERVQFEDGTAEPFDAIIYATGYNIAFPFFDRAFLSVEDNRLGLYKRMLLPDADDVVFMGFAQPLPSLFPFVEVQSRLLAAYLAGTYRPPSPREMQARIEADDTRFTANFSPRPRHTQQLDYYLYAHELLGAELLTGARRASQLGPVRLRPPSRLPPDGNSRCRLKN
jgi:cation diffusion facilitator CzcD-associated flavoprotein CzcO